MARCLPVHKYLLVTGIKEKGNVVAVTGDGTNDAPAMTRSDVSFAMGTGSEMAKNVSKIILTTDDFCATVETVKFGRNIFDSVRKFLQFQLTINVVAMAIVFIGAILFTEPVLTPVQILWVNLIMDTFAALALATEKPHEALLDRAPMSKTAPIINRQMIRNIIGWSVAQIAIMLIILYYTGAIFKLDIPSNDCGFYWAANDTLKYPNYTGAIVTGEPTPLLQVYTLAFHTFVIMQLFNIVNARKLGTEADKKQTVDVEDYNIFSGICANLMFVVIVLGSFGIQFALIYVPALEKPMRVMPLTWQQNLFAVGCGFFMIPWTLLVKCIPSTWFSCMAKDTGKNAAVATPGFIGSKSSRRSASARKSAGGSKT